MAQKSTTSRIRESHGQLSSKLPSHFLSLLSRSIEYSADCVFKREAGVEVYVVVAVVTLVVLVAGAVIAWAKLRTQHNPQPENAETP